MFRYSKQVHGVVEGDRNIGNRNDEIHGPTQEQTNLINGTNNQQARVFVDEESAYGSRTSFESGNIWLYKLYKLLCNICDPTSTYEVRETKLCLLIFPQHKIACSSAS